jgi:hypothetical protein
VQGWEEVYANAAHVTRYQPEIGKSVLEYLFPANRRQSSFWDRPSDNLLQSFNPFILFVLGWFHRRREDVSISPPLRRIDACPSDSETTDSATISQHSTSTREVEELEELSIAMGSRGRLGVLLQHF